MAAKWIFFIVVGFYHKGGWTRADDVKTWRMDTNFENIRNWEGGRLPCPKDRVIFAASSPVAIYMPRSLSFAEMILPLDGSLIFPRDAQLGMVGGVDSASCKGEDVRFKLSKDVWYNPDNWNYSSGRALAHPQSSGRNSAVPHIYQVPCRTDGVVFPSNVSFKVDDIYPAASISSLNINAHAYTQEDFNSFVNTPLGKLLFPGSPKLQVTGTQCTDRTGCLCGNEDELILSTICQFKWPCPDVKCYDPIEVVGHCCPICATKLTMEYGQQFEMETIVKVLQALHKDNVPAYSFTSKISESSIQSVFVDDTFGNAMASDLAKKFASRLDGGRNFGILSYKLEKSERWTEYAVPASSRYSSGGMSSGGIAGLVIFIMLILGLGATFFVYKKRHIPGFSFARFDLRSDRIELELGTTPHDELEPGENPVTTVPLESNKGFDNPVYGTNATSEESADVPESTEDKNFVENPMFLIFEESSKKDLQ